MGLKTFVVALLATSAIAAQVPIPRPAVKAWPKNPGKPHIEHPLRDPLKVCVVKPSCTPGKDDAPKILKAFQDCNNGGTVVFNKNYTIGSPLNLTFLHAVDVVLTGTINFSTDIKYWVDHSFKIQYQNSSTFWLIGGTDVNIYGGGVGTLNGNGQPWWEEFTKNSTLLRPILFVTDGLHGGTISGLNMINSPNWFNLIGNSTDVLISDLVIKSFSVTKTTPKNTDGWDTYRSDSVVIQNSNIDNGDDCVSFKPNSTNMVVQGLVCNGSHGISVGSLGQYKGQVDIVENIYVYNTSMSNASDGARIKVWPGVSTLFQDNLNGGGGLGYVRNVTYDIFHSYNNVQAITFTQCYGSSNQTLCNEYPSNMTISDITFKNMDGVGSKSNDPKLGALICSAREKCINIQAHNITIKPPSGKTGTWTCTNMDNSLLDINCV